jgi:hypothetical protein
MALLRGHWRFRFIGQWKLDRDYPGLFFLSTIKRQNNLEMSATVEAIKKIIADMPATAMSLVPTIPTLAQIQALRLWPKLNENKNYRALAVVIMLALIVSIPSIWMSGAEDELFGEGDELFGDSEEPTLMDTLSETLSETLGGFLGANPKPKAAAQPKAAGSPPKKKRSKWARAGRFFWTFFTILFVSWIVVNQVVVTPVASSAPVIAPAADGAAYVPYRSSYRPSYRSY